MHGFCSVAKKTRVPVKCEIERNETKPMETKSNEIKRNETKRIFWMKQVPMDFTPKNHMFSFCHVIPVYLYHILLLRVPVKCKTK